jgi:hypothetical protein
LIHLVPVSLELLPLAAVTTTLPRLDVLALAETGPG